MSAASEIQAKLNELIDRGLDLGAQIGNDMDAGSGGRVRVFERGRIYWHENTGTHEVHGGILQKYLDEGGPGANPETGRRHFGYPISDETRTLDGLHPVSHFEFGDIIFLPGTSGGVTIHDAFFQEWKRKSSELGSLLYPITEPIPVAGGQAVYFERGCLWRGPATNNEIIAATFNPPLLGNPKLVRPEPGEIRNFMEVRWHGLPQDTLDLILRNRPALFSEIWNDRIVIRRVARSAAQRVVISLLTQDEDFQGGSPDRVNVILRFRLPTNGPIRPQDRALYDLGIRHQNNSVFAVSPHAYYVARDWQDFGFIHATDIHVAERIERFQSQIDSLATSDPTMAEAARHFNNFNDNFRDLIRYANHLHEEGLLDAIIATGDLVDYAFEDGKVGGGNYDLFRRIILGRASAASGMTSEELLVPIFTVFGNHDYRLNPYNLLFDIDLPFVDDFTVPMYSPYNLTEEETETLQGRRPFLSATDALPMLEIDTLNQRRSYDYYQRRINRSDSYTVALGSHRLVMIDTQFDAGVPSDLNAGTIITLISNFFADDLNEDTLTAVGGSPNLKGYAADDLVMLQSAISEASDGLVIVGMHAPPLNIAGSELAHYFRETEHPTVDGREIDAFLARHNGAGVANNWPRSGTKHFKTGQIEDLLDSGIARGDSQRFFELCTGAGGARPVDLVLCGHDHDRVEYRVTRNANNPGFRFFMDFYLSVPDAYYPSRKAGLQEKAHLRIRDSAAVNGNVRRVRDNRFDPPLRYNQLDVPPYANSLDSVLSMQATKSAWWISHRPLIVETAALGPLDRSQRVVGSTRPSVSFMGFRYFGVRSGVIHNAVYIALRELRENSFVMPWESAGNAPDPGPFDPPPNPPADPFGPPPSPDIGRVTPS